MTWTHLDMIESLVKEVIEGRMIGKRGRGKSRIMLLNDINTNETYEMIARIALNRESWSVI